MSFYWFIIIYLYHFNHCFTTMTMSECNKRKKQLQICVNFERRFKRWCWLCNPAVLRLGVPQLGGPKPKRPGHSSFLLFIKTQITNIAQLPSRNTSGLVEIYSLWMLVPVDWLGLCSSCIWAMYGVYWVHKTFGAQLQPYQIPSES